MCCVCFRRWPKTSTKWSAVWRRRPSSSQRRRNPTLRAPSLWPLPSCGKPTYLKQVKSWWTGRSAFGRWLRHGYRDCHNSWSSVLSVHIGFVCWSRFCLGFQTVHHLLFLFVRERCPHCFPYGLDGCPVCALVVLEWCELPEVFIVLICDERFVSECSLSLFVPLIICSVLG